MRKRMTAVCMSESSPKWMVGMKVASRDSKRRLKSQLLTSLDIKFEHSCQHL